MSVKSEPMAAIDVGSNTIHLTVARPLPDGRDLEFLADEVALVRLGADVSANGAIGPERMERALNTLRHQEEVALGAGANVILGIATEGVRAAANGAELLARSQRELGITLEMITGDQEAALTYWGATSGLATTDARRAVLDLGGGSMEIVIGEGSHIHWRASLPLGSGAIHDRYTPSDPARAEELAAAHEIVSDLLRPLTLPLPVAEAIVSGGTATTLAMLAARSTAERASAAPEQPPRNEMSKNSNGRVTSLSRSLMRELLDLLRHQTAADLAARYDIEEGRGRLLAAGATVLLATMERLGVEALRVRKRGIREGALLAYAHVGADWLALAERGAGW